MTANLSFRYINKTGWLHIYTQGGSAYMLQPGVLRQFVDRNEAYHLAACEQVSTGRAVYPVYEGQRNSIVGSQSCQGYGLAYQNAALAWRPLPTQSLDFFDEGRQEGESEC